MARIPRNQLPPGRYHCINRGVNRQLLFIDNDDYRWFNDQLLLARKNFAIDIPAYCLMPNHWHIVVEVQHNIQMSKMFQYLLNEQTRRHHAKYRTIGHGPIYQGRFKSFLIKDDRAFENICNYIEQNPVRASIVSLKEQWLWSSANARRLGQRLGSVP